MNILPKHRKIKTQRHFSARELIAFRMKTQLDRFAAKVRDLERSFDERARRMEASTPENFREVWRTAQGDALRRMKLSMWASRRQFRRWSRLTSQSDNPAARRALQQSIRRVPRQRAHRATRTRTTSCTSPPGSSDGDPEPPSGRPNHHVIIEKITTGTGRRGNAA